MWQDPKLDGTLPPMPAGIIVDGAKLPETLLDEFAQPRRPVDKPNANLNGNLPQVLRADLEPAGMTHNHNKS